MQFIIDVGMPPQPTMRFPNRGSLIFLSIVSFISAGLERRKKKKVRCDLFPNLGFSPLCSFAPILQARCGVCQAEPLPPQPTMRTDLDIGARNSVTTAVTGFFYPIFQVKPGRYPTQRIAFGEDLNYFQQISRADFAIFM